MQNNLTNESLVLVTFLHRPARKQIEPILQLTLGRRPLKDQSPCVCVWLKQNWIVLIYNETLETTVHAQTSPHLVQF